MKQFIGLGRRKTSVARIYLRPGKGEVLINKKRTLESVLHRKELVLSALFPLKVTEQASKWNVVVTVHGGGCSSQADAISHGLARALLKTDESLRALLRKHKLLTRDARMVERKKYGQRGARRQFQFSKR